jgi:GxxExxY protein
MRCTRQQVLPLRYKGIRLDCAYRIDLLVDETVLLELKSIESLQPIHEAQLLTYLRHTGLWLGMLMNFNVPIMHKGVRRIVNG